MQRKMLPQGSGTCHCAASEMRAGPLGNVSTSYRIVCVLPRIHGSLDVPENALYWSPVS